ncbi:F0F1 ATP synthase subunit alpha [Emcibacter nanhaiensis]|uniref:F0F1 ATP synthase subunit alpha n=1 Tax=Emcibacter nanhaiensis TaxID=1505037 RepID=A0A501PIS1_9PROT|nr:F0F1 ATP synthase subunit alpha [Emcibacter nanhaiensis]TPD59834.1 F0F1 ATP synthase subunit alpha [Emcibacter nanhaiensis]
MRSDDRLPEAGGQLLRDYQFSPRLAERGIVTAVGDGVMWIEGLPSVAIEDLVRTEDGSLALVYLLSAQRVGAMILEETPDLSAGMAVSLTGRRLTLQTGDGFLGRVIDPLGFPLDDGEAVEGQDERFLDHPSPQITARDFVHEPLYTGNRIVDTMIPIGHGQRQLLIGDNGTGKSSLALDTVLNQKDSGTLCVYVMIGQKRAAVASLVETLREQGALAWTTVVVAEATARPGLKYLAPYAGCTLAEHWMESGRKVLVVYDDLSTHARVYRELSLLLRRPPGREAYPGDVFYLHSRLLERSTCLSAEKGGGSMSALAIVETQQDEISAYIPTNLISITDGQIYFDRKLFAAGVLPAVDVRRSVSRIGGAAQHPAIKKEAARMKLDYLQFLELEVFSHFGARLEENIQNRLKRGRLLREILKQDLQSAFSPEMQLAWMVAFNDGLFADKEGEEIKRLLKSIAEAVARGRLRLDDPRDQWAALVGRLT